MNYLLGVNTDKEQWTMMLPLCKNAEEIKSRGWKHCNFLTDDDGCQFSGSCSDQDYFSERAKEYQRKS